MKKIRLSLALGFFTTLSLTYAIILKKHINLDFDTVIRYAFVGILVFLYSMLLNYFKLHLAHLLFMVTLILSNLYLILFMPIVSEGFNDLGMILTWMILNVTGITFGLLLQLIKYIKDHYNQ